LGKQELGELGTANPLTFYNGAVEAMFSFAEADFPYRPVVYVIMGAEGRPYLR
jgi:hypothetical protein